MCSIVKHYCRIYTSNFDYRKCIISLSDYTQFNKAEILYNHLYFSNISKININKILENRNYMNIINHLNYSPRIIESMTIMQTSADPDFFQVFMDNLNNPQRLWKHAFEFQISGIAQQILIVMSTLTNHVLLDDLELAVGVYSTVISHNEFNKALRQLEGNFIIITKNGNERVVRFSNPSIRDFIENYLSENIAELRSLINSLIFFDQCINLWNNKVCNVVLKEKLSQMFIDTLIKLFNANTFSFVEYSGISYLSKAVVHPEERFIFIIEILQHLQTKNYPSDITQIEDFIYASIKNGNSKKQSSYPLLLKKLDEINFNINIHKDDWIKVMKLNLFENLEHFAIYEIFPKLENFYEDFFLSDEKKHIEENFILIIDEERRYYLEEETDTDNISGFCSSLEEVSSFLNIDVSDSIDVLDDRVRDLEEDQYADYDDDEWRDFERDNSGDNIESLFETLK